ncbi:MAG: nucleotidyltransferase domain-containing protein [Promethearchaeota archaeon]
MIFKFEKSSIVCNLPPKVCSYLKDIERLIKNKIGFNNIYSIVLFGSYARDDYSENSDIDLLIIIKDEFFKSHNLNYIKYIEKLAIGIELKNNLRIRRTSFVTAVLNVIEKTTGMFISHFICKKSDWDKQIFHKIFNVNGFLAKLIAPGDIVLKNMSKSYMVLYGEKLEPHYKEHITSVQLLKSLIMTELIAVGTIIIFPLWRNTIRYSLEAFKWTIRNSYLYLFNEQVSKKKMEQFFTESAVSKEFFRKYNSLRKKLKRDFYFALQCPFEILKIYMASFKYRKMFSNNSINKNI